MEPYIPTFLNAELLDSGIQRYIPWEYEKEAHILIFGGTGSGKTFASKLLLGRIARHISDAEIIVADFKGDSDFSFLSGCDNYYRFQECQQGLDIAFKKLQERQQDALKKHTFFILFFDEWASFLANLDKKASEQNRQKLGSLLMLGRSFNIHVAISQQRADASYFASARDNFSFVMGLGRLSKESVDMLFHDFKEEINPVKPRGCGSLLIGERFWEVAVPVVARQDVLHSCIRTAVERSVSSSATFLAGQAGAEP